MKTVSDAETVTASEDKIRKSLHELQPSAVDKETLVGGDRKLKSTQQLKKEKPKKDILKKTKDTSKRKNVTTKNKAVQTEKEKVEIEAEDLTCTGSAGPSENYWEVLAERRRIVLKDALAENQELAERVDKLEEENRIWKEMLDETRALVEVLKEMVDDDGNGINNSLDDSVF